MYMCNCICSLFIWPNFKLSFSGHYSSLYTFHLTALEFLACLTFLNQFALECWNSCNTGDRSPQILRQTSQSVISSLQAAVHCSAARGRTEKYTSTSPGFGNTRNDQAGIGYTSFQVYIWETKINLINRIIISHKCSKQWIRLVSFRYGDIPL